MMGGYFVSPATIPPGPYLTPAETTAWLVGLVLICLLMIRR